MSEKQNGLSLLSNLKIGLFHLGSGMADVLTTGVWNRVMISDLGVAATPVSLLVSLRYFLAPLGIWAGRLSDDREILGFRRLFWVWLGRFLMVLSTFGLGFATAQFAENAATASVFNWLIIIASMVLFSFGNAISGTTFLALIYDRATDKQRGRAVGIVWTFLLLGFTIGGIVFSIMLPKSEGATALSFTPSDLLQLFLVAGGIFFGLWFVSMVGEEKRHNDNIRRDAGEHATSLRDDLALVWRSLPMRFFLFYLTISMFFAFSQDPVLEPFGGDVFNMDAGVTNRFAAYWGSTSILGTIFFLWLSRRMPRFTNTVMSQWGVGVLFVTFVLLTVAALFTIEPLLMPSLLLLGIGLGMWNVGTLGLMMDMSPVGRAGTFLGFWSMAVTLARGGGITGGGIVRDMGLQLSGSSNIAYALVFGGAALGLVVAAWCLSRIHVENYKETEIPTVEAVFAGSMD
jgi:BCD family chlorophyll transporter-like MFS transporter